MPTDRTLLLDGLDRLLVSISTAVRIGGPSAEAAARSEQVATLKHKVESGAWGPVPAVDWRKQAPSVEEVERRPLWWLRERADADPIVVALIVADGEVRVDWVESPSESADAVGGQWLPIPSPSELARAAAYLTAQRDEIRRLEAKVAEARREGIVAALDAVRATGLMFADQAADEAGAALDARSGER